MAYQQHGGAADSYYQGGQQGVMQPPQSYQQNGYQQEQNQYPPQEPPQQYPPPQYQDNGKHENHAQGGKGFEQAFTIEKPKLNDLWATILFLATFLGFAAVSGLALHGYSASIGNQGSSFSGNGAGSSNSVSLNTNTIVLL